MHQVLSCGRLQQQNRDKAHRALELVAYHQDRGRLAFTPESHEPRGFRTFVVRHHRHQRRSIRWAQPVGKQVVVDLEVEDCTHRRGIAVEKDQLRQHAALIKAGRLAQAGMVEAAGPAMQFDIPVRVAPAQVGGHRLAHQVMREQAVAPGFHKRQAAQPVEVGMGIVEFQHRRQERLGHVERQARRFERCAVEAAGGVMNEAGKQRLDNVGDRERLKVIAGLLVQHIGNQRNGERMAVGEADDSTALHGGHGAQVEIGHTLIGGKIPQRHHLQQALPAGIGDPGRAGCAAGGHHRQGRSRQFGQERLAQPALEHGQVFTRIQQQHRALRPAV